MINFDITEAAASRISELINNEVEAKIGIRISIDAGGCSGFMYDYKLIDKINEDDFVLEQYGVRIIIDSMSQAFLEGCKLEFIEDLGGSYFQITNPNALHKCGCGNSFYI